MRIDNKNTPGLEPQKLQGTESTRETGQGAHGGTSGSSPLGGDRVQLSSLAEILRQLDPASPERLARLQQLEELVRTGRYEPDPEALGEALINEALSDSVAGTAAASGLDE